MPTPTSFLDVKSIMAVSLSFFAEPSRHLAINSAKPLFPPPFSSLDDLSFPLSEKGERERGEEGPLALYAKKERIRGKASYRCRAIFHSVMQYPSPLPTLFRFLYSRYEEKGTIRDRVLNV